LIRAAVLGFVFALASLAQQQLTVDKLTEFITSSISQKVLDKDVAAFLASVKLTERLSPRAVEDLQSKGAGPRTVAALTRIAEASATLPAPAPKAAAPKPKPPRTPPSDQDQQRIIEEAREHALNYSKTLPDFICLQVTNRYLDRHYKPGTEGSWSVSDRLAEKLTYFDQQEKYEAVSHNDTSLYGKAGADKFGGALSRGDFGTLLREIFDPKSSAEFHWERWSGLPPDPAKPGVDTRWMHVYTYAIDQAHSNDTLDYNNGAARTTPGYHGEIFIEEGPNLVWRITVEPEPPASFPMQNIHQVLDYRYTELSGQKFLLPVNGTVIMRADGVGSKNEINFRSYRKYSADTSIKFDDADDADQKPDENKPEDKKAPQPKQ
jgi:hypothetical protein